MCNYTRIIHYQNFDSLGNVVRVLVDADNNTNTGKTDYDANGNEVSGIDQILTYSYDIYGRRVDYNLDGDASGATHRTETYVLDTNGYQIEQQIDLTGDGSVDQKVAYTRNANGNELSRTNYLLDSEGNAHETSKYIYLLDENGQPIAQVEYLTGNSTPSSVEIYERDGLGRVVTTYRDNNADGNLVTLGTDRDGNTIITQINGTKDASGHYSFTNTNGVDSITYAQYDAYDRVIKREYDNDANGNIDNNSQYEYNPVTGAMIKQLQDTTNSGTPDIIYEYDRGAYDTITEERKYEMRNGELTLTQRYYDYEYDYSTLAWTKRTIDRTGNGVTSDDVTYLREFDAQGRAIKETFINALNPDDVSTQYNLEFDNANRLTRYHRDDRPEGPSSNDYYVNTVYDPATGSSIASERINYNGSTAWTATSEYKENNSIL